MEFLSLISVEVSRQSRLSLSISDSNKEDYKGCSVLHEGLEVKGSGQGPDGTNT